MAQQLRVFRIKFSTDVNYLWGLKVTQRISIIQMTRGTKKLVAAEILENDFQASTAKQFASLKVVLENLFVLLGTSRKLTKSWPKVAVLG